MRLIPADFYAQRRVVPSGEACLQENPAAGLLTERLLQWVWHYQRLRRDHLRTLDGRTVRVLHPGFWNREAGPDFRGAVIQFGSEAAASGDIEIDLEPKGWHSHRHQYNPDYRQVFLHVVWDSPAGLQAALPTLALKDCLDAPLAELKEWFESQPNPGFTLPMTGRCCAPLHGMPSAAVTELLEQAGLIRLKRKAALFENRARQAGWERSLWEGLFGALGYKHNYWAMRRVAELVPVLLNGAGSSAASVLYWQACLFGVSGLLPAHVDGKRSGHAPYLRRIWEIWWREREPCQEHILPKSIWRLHGARPANHPQRRLALAAHWLASGRLMRALGSWFAETIPDHELLPSLLRVLQVEKDDFWSRHWTFRSAGSKPHPLLGPGRATDLAVNALLPWFWARSNAGKNDTSKQTVECRYFRWPKAEDNAVLRLARQRLFGGPSARILKSAAQQQGLLQIVRDFCEHSNAVCDRCRFPELVRDLRIETNPASPIRPGKD